jgi:hypothetical protein
MVGRLVAWVRVGAGVLACVAGIAAPTGIAGSAYVLHRQHQRMRDGGPHGD